MRLKIKRLGPAVAVAAVLATLPAAPASADSSNAVPLSQLSGFDNMVVSAAGYVFLSQGSGGKGIVVTGLFGNYRATLESGDNVAGMALSPDGDTLYAALTGGPDAGEIAKIPVSAVTGTFSQALYPLGAGDTPGNLAMQNGTLWVSYSDTSTGDGAIGAVDPSTGTFTAGALPRPATAWPAAPILAADPGGKGVLVAAEPGASSTEAASYNVAGPTPVMTAQTTALSGCGNLADLAVAPGGTQFITACSTADTHNVYSTAGLSLLNSHPAADSSPDAVAISPDGTVAAGTGGPSPLSTSTIRFFSPSGSQLNTIYDSIQLAPRGLAWSADGTELLALENNGLSYWLEMYYYPTIPPYTLTVKAPAKVLIARRYALTVKITQFIRGKGVPLGLAQVRITRTKPGTATMHWTRRTDDNGIIKLSNVPPAAGTYTYIVAFGGLLYVAGGTVVTRKVTVTKRTPSLKITTNRNTSPHQGRIKITAHLGHTYKNHTVKIYAQTVGARKEVLIKRGRVNIHGYLRAWYRASRSKVFTVAFTGDPHYKARKASHTVGVHAKVAVKYTGYYAASRINGKTFHIFRHTARLKAATRVAPNKHGQCVRVQTQKYFNGSWHASTITGCRYLNRYSMKTVTRSMAHAARGRHYRVRVDYRRKSSDHSNLSTPGHWFYFIVRR